MANYTIKAYLQMQAKNKQGLVPVYLRYYYDKKQSAHPLGVTVKPRDFNDAGQGSFRASGENAAANNAKLQRYVECLDAAAASIEDPVWAKVKPGFLALLQEREAQTQKQREDKEWTHKILHDLREGVGARSEAAAESLASLRVTQAKIERALRNRFPAEHLIFPASLVEQEEEKHAHDQFHEQAKLYIKQFKGKPISPLSHHHIEFADGEKMRLDMDVPAHAWYKTLLEFEKWAGWRTTFANIDRRFYDKYSDFLWDVKDFEDASHFNHVSRLKMFLNESVSFGFQVNPFFRHKSFKTYKKAKPIHALREDELEALRHMDLGKKQLNKVRDLFCFQAFTGLRYSDLQRPQEIKKDRMVGKTQKTSGNYSIPLVLYPDQRIEELGEKMNWDFTIDKDTYRRCIKRMMHAFFAKRGEAPIAEVHIYKRNEAVLDPATGRMPTQPLAEAFSSHNARKTFCTIMFNKGYSVEMVAKMIGSKRQELLRENYISFIDSDLDKMIKKSEAEKELQARIDRQEAELAALRQQVSTSSPG